MRRCRIVLLILLLLVCNYSGSARVLKQGMRGTDVLNLQVLLVDLGYQISVDGIFGPETETLIRHLQDALGLTVDGLVGQETSAILEKLQKSVIKYTVKSGDNLTRLANKYDTTVSNISTYNGLINPDRINPGQVLLIPTNSLAVQSRAFISAPKFIWPVQGPLSCGYGYRIHPITRARHFHAGIDIAVNQGTRVRAAATGKVIQAGSMGNYGLGVVLDHGGGYTTWYGHNSQLLVRTGDFVQQGAVIALSGRTGIATGPHLDFRIKIGDQTVDPLEFLP